MELYEAIRTRRSVGKVKPEAPSRETIERILDAATWAPFHHVAEPWRFIVIGGSARRRLGEIVAQTASIENVPAEMREKVLDKERARLERAPVIIAVVALPADDPVDQEENFAAASAATQNLLLAARAEGLSGFWRTGRLVSEPRMTEALGVTPGERIVAYVYLGTPMMTPAQPARTPSAHKTTWIEE